MKKIVKEYRSDGYIFDDEPPSCSFCDASAEDTEICETDYSGEFICGEIDCWNQYMNQNVWGKYVECEEKEVQVCDRCFDDIDESDEIHHLKDEDVCGYCIEDKEIV
tara:strand:+ start:5541 stop:5861 length:321 start_codon:yes stop_codon:yes gene_type:complete